jgi:hypothetical protein
LQDRVQILLSMKQQYLSLIFSRYAGAGHGLEIPVYYCARSRY